MHASAPAKPCLNIVLELTGPCRAATNRNETQLERLALVVDNMVAIRKTWIRFFVCCCVPGHPGHVAL